MINSQSIIDEPRDEHGVLGVVLRCPCCCDANSATGIPVKNCPYCRMKISIEIEDATPEEVRRILFVAAGPEKVTISPIAHKPPVSLSPVKGTPPTHKKEAKKVPAEKKTSSGWLLRPNWRGKNAKVKKSTGVEKKSVETVATPSGQSCRTVSGSGPWR